MMAETTERLKQRIRKLEIELVRSRRAEEALRGSEMELSAIYGDAPIPMFVVDSDRRLRKINAPALAMARRAEEEVIGLRGGEALRCFHAYDDPRGCGFGPACKTCVMRNTVQDTFETRQSHHAVEAPIPYDAEGGVVPLWVLVSTSFLELPEGEMVLVCLEDITDRKRAEKAMEARARQQAALADLGQYALAGEDLDELINEAAKRLAATLEVEYCKILELLPDGQALLLRAGVGWKEGLVGRETVGAKHESQAGYTLLSRQPVIVEDLSAESRFSATPLLRDHGVVSGMSTVIEGREGPWGVLGAHTTQRRVFSKDDVNYLQAAANVLAAAIVRKQAERERERLIAELESKNAELERFTYTVSHDLKSPLVTINGFLGMLRQDAAAGDAEAMEEDMTVISNAAHKMEQLLEGLLELSRIGRQVNPPEEIALADLAEEVVSMTSVKLGERGIRVEISPDMPVVLGDRLRLWEVLQNLIDNAAKFMGDQDDARIEIGSRLDGEETVCYVRDNGMGIDPAFHEKVFGLFDRLDLKSEGTGVGLAIVMRIVEVHGGRIWIESEGPGQGSTFCFTIPRKGEDNQA